jgi:phosphoglycolate phosphatase-like HAD superfamily hydrolase
VARQSVAVFDLDGTLADTRHRLCYLDTRPKNWDAFFDAAKLDAPLPKGVALALASAEEHDIAYVTGRPERCRRDTEAWIAEHGLPKGKVWMRGTQDRRPAKTAKLELLKRLAGKQDVALVVDDDPLVCDAYRKAGFTVVEADWMPASPVLSEAQDAEGRT